MRQVGLLLDWYKAYLSERWRKTGLLGVSAAFAGFGNDLANPVVDWSSYLSVAAAIALVTVFVMAVLTGRRPPESPYQKEIVGDAISLTLFAALVFGLVSVAQLALGRPSATLTAAEQIGLMQKSLDTIGSKLGSIEQLLSANQPLKNPRTELEFYANARIFEGRHDTEAAWANLSQLATRFSPMKFETGDLYKSLGIAKVGRNATAEKLREIAEKTRDRALEYFVLSEFIYPRKEDSAKLVNWLDSNPDDPISHLRFISERLTDYLAQVGYDQKQPLINAAAGVVTRGRKIIGDIPLSQHFFQTDNAASLIARVDARILDFDVLSGSLADYQARQMAAAEIEQRNLEHARRDNEIQAERDRQEALQRKKAPPCKRENIDRDSIRISCNIKGLKEYRIKINSRPWELTKFDGRIYTGINLSVNGARSSVRFTLMWIHESGSEYGPFYYNF